MPENIMDRFDRIYALDKELRSACHPVPGKVLQQILECSRATLNRIIEDMPEFYGCAHYIQPSSQWLPLRTRG